MPVVVGVQKRSPKADVQSSTAKKSEKNRKKFKKQTCNKSVRRDKRRGDCHDHLRKSPSYNERHGDQKEKKKGKTSAGLAESQRRKEIRDKDK